MTNANETRTAIITGAARGIGVALAKRLAQDGFAVVINYANSATSADALVEELTAGDGNQGRHHQCRCRQTDV